MRFGRPPIGRGDPPNVESGPDVGRPGRGHRSAGSFLLKDVPNSAHGLQQAGPAALLELLPQIADVDVDHVAAGAEVETPDRIKQLFAPQDLARVTHEVL